jgi:hypothetical protein
VLPTAVRYLILIRQGWNEVTVILRCVISVCATAAAVDLLVSLYKQIDISVLNLVLLAYYNNIHSVQAVSTCDTGEVGLPTECFSNKHR